MNELENLRIATPCRARWDEMVGDERIRFCASCRKNVYNLSAMTRKETEDLVASQEGRLCALMYRRADGTVLTADCPVGRRRRAARWLRRAVASVGAAVAVFSGQIFTAKPKPAPVPSASASGHIDREVLEQLLGSLGYVDPG